MTPPTSILDAWNLANGLVGTPYVYGGGHNKDFAPSRGVEGDEPATGPEGLDCSGFFCYIAHRVGWLDADFPLNTEALESWGDPGRGEFFTLHVIDIPNVIHHCILEFELPEHLSKHYIAARFTGTTIQWYPTDTGPWLVEGYNARRVSDPGPS